MDKYIAENIMEITYVFIDLMKKGKLKDEDDYTRESAWNSFKNECVSWAEDFENKYKFDDDDYIDSIFKFAENKILEKYGKDQYYTAEVRIKAINVEDAKSKIKSNFPGCAIMRVIKSS